MSISTACGIGLKTIDFLTTDRETFQSYINKRKNRIIFTAEPAITKKAEKLKFCPKQKMEIRIIATDFMLVPTYLYLFLLVTEIFLYRSYIINHSS